MISVKEAQQIHKLLIDSFGGAHGIRDVSSLESAVKRPFQTFDNKELYPTGQLTGGDRCTTTSLKNKRLNTDSVDQRCLF